MTVALLHADKNAVRQKQDNEAPAPTLTPDMFTLALRKFAQQDFSRDVTNLDGAQPPLHRGSDRNLHRFSPSPARSHTVSCGIFHSMFTFGHMSSHSHTRTFDTNSFFVSRSILMSSNSVDFATRKRGSVRNHHRVGIIFRWLPIV